MLRRWVLHLWERLQVYYEYLMSWHQLCFSRPNWQKDSYFTCEDDCQYFTKACKGICLNGTKLCGNDTCIEPGSWYDTHYRECGNQCIYKSEQCEKHSDPCPPMYRPCGKEEYGRCVDDNMSYRYFECGNRCIWNSTWSVYHYKPCGDECLYR